MAKAARREASLLAVVLAPGIACTAADAAVTLLGAQYKRDRAFSEHECFWHHSDLPGPCGPSEPLGASVHLFLLNSGSSSVTVADVTLAGISLELALYEEEQVVKRHPVSIYFALAHGAITQQQFDTLVDAGEPVWYKASPTTIPPGGTGQVVVRMRQVPAMPSVSIGVVHSSGPTSTTVPVEPECPEVAGVSFSSNLTKVYLYWRRVGGTAPTTILMNGNDVTANTTTVSDPGVDIAASLLQLGQPLSVMSFHVFQGVYADGRIASAGVRAWPNPFIYGTWGAQPGASGDYAAARAWIDDATNHCVNALVVQGGSDAVKSYLQTAEGRQYAADHGYGFVIDEIGKWSCQDPLMWFIRDEPDAADSRVTGLPGNKMVGSLADMCVEQGEALRLAYPEAPTTLNIDGTYKPFNWYNYGQVPHVLMTDPYYQARLRGALWYYPERIPLYSKATYIYAVSQVAQSSGEPNPLHVVLYSCEYVDTTTSQRFPFAPPECKRIEVYYALAAGAKGLSYWWFKPGSPSNGLGAGTADALALWREIGLLGAEMRTASPLLVTSCPVSLPIQASEGLWVRSLLVGTDTIVLLVVNDQYYNDQQGCHYTPITGANMVLTLPAWITSASAFEIATGGVGDIMTQVGESQLEMNLGTVNVTRMIVVTGDTQLRTAIQQWFNQEVQPKVCAMAPEECVPNIVRQPQPQSVRAGEAVMFTVGATGAGMINYQWRKDQVNLSDGDHYSGVTTSSLSISGTQESDAGNYTCVVSNAYGSDMSNEAALTVTPGQPGDYDGDGDVDLSDFGHFQACLTGRAVPVTDPVCQNANLDGDSNVDLDDFGIFQRCLSGANIPAEPSCAD